MKKKFIIAIIGVMTIISVPIKVLAAPEVINVNGTDIIFDSDYYAANNLDVVAVLGTDKNVLLQHYIAFGQYEGRVPYESEREIDNMVDTNQYGNFIGNLYNDGSFVYDLVGNTFYLYDVYENCIVKTDVVTGNTSVILNKPLFSLNYRNGKLYGIELTSNGDVGSLIECDVATGNTMVLHTAPVRYAQLVNNELYFTDNNDNLLRKINVETGEESILTAESVYYPVVYKDRIIFQLDSDNESLYLMSKDGGVMTKLNNYHSHYPIVYNDIVYYRTDENGVCKLRSINLDGSEDTELLTTNFWKMNICDGRLYFIKKDTPNIISYIELSDNSHTIKELQVESSIRNALNKTYGANAVQVTSYSVIQFAGNYAMVLCQELIDGNSYIDEYIYVVNTNETKIIPEFCISKQTTVSVPLSEASKQEQARTVAQSIANSIPAGTDLERVRTAAEIVADYCNRAIYTSDDPDYRTAYGVLCKGVYTCAGSTRALGLVLDCMGYNWSHINENKYTHQWCELVMDGQIGWADGMGGIADYGICPFQAGGVYRDANGWIYVPSY